MLEYLFVAIQFAVFDVVPLALGSLAAFAIYATMIKKKREGGIAPLSDDD